MDIFFFFVYERCKNSNQASPHMQDERRHCCQRRHTKTIYTMYRNQPSHDMQEYTRKCRQLNTG